MKGWTLGVVVCLGIIRAPVAQSPNPLFVAAPAVTVGLGSGQIVFADLNRDGRLDMVTRHLLQRRIGVWLGDGKGGFTASAGTPMALDYQPGGIAAADVNGDGTPDLVVTKSERDEVDVFLGDGKGGFTRGAGSPFADSPSSDFFTRSVDLLDVNDRNVRASLLDDSPVFDHVRKDRIEALIQRSSLPNSESKFLFYFLNAKLFMEEFAS